MTISGDFICSLSLREKMGWFALSREDRAEIIIKLDVGGEKAEDVREFLAIIADPLPGRVV